MATFLEWTGADVVRGNRRRQVVNGDGTIEIFTAAQPMGQSLATTFTQLAVDVFGVPGDRSAYRSATPIAAPGSAAPDRARCSSSGRPCASRPSALSTKAHDLAAKAARSCGCRHRVPRRRVQHRRHRPAHRPVRARATASATSASSLGSTSAVDAPSWPNGCHVCEVEVDPETGAVAARRLLVGERRRPRRQSDGRHRPARRRCRAGHRPGAVRALRLRRANRDRR